MSDAPVTTDPDRDLGRLYAEAPHVRDLARRLAHGDADDVEQEAWLRVLQRPQPAVAEPRRWLSRVVRRVVMNLRRSERRRAAHEVASAAPDGVPTSHELLEREERRRALVAAVDALPPSLRSVVLLRWFKGLAPREIGARLGLPATTVSTLLHRGLAVLRRRLDAGLGDESGSSRRAWLAPLCVFGDGFAPPPVEVLPAAPALGTGAIVMTMKTKLVAAAAAVVVAAGAFALWGSGDLPPAHADAPFDAPSVAAAAASDAARPAAAAAASSDPAPSQRDVAPLVAEHASLRVVVVWADQTPAADVPVQLHRRGGPRFAPEQGRTDAGGVAEFARLVPGRYTPSCDRGDWHRGAVVELVAAERGEARIELPVGLTARGRVVDGLGRPVADADLVVADWGGGSTTVLRASAADGTFSLRALATLCHVGARKRGYRPSSMRTFTTEEGAEVDFTIVLEAGGGSLSGTVFGPDGAPLAGAAVRAGSTEQNNHKLPDGASAMGSQPEVLRTDDRGRFEFACVQPGPVPLAVRAPGLAPWAQEVQVPAGGTADVQVHLLAGAVVAGVVADDGGEVVAGVDVRVGSWDEFAGSYTSSASDGTFRLEGLPVGTVEAALRSEGHGSLSTRLELVAGAELRWDPVLSRGLTLRGVVLGHDGEPVARAMVDAGLDPWRPGDRWHGNAHTDEQGRFEVPNCLPGRTISVKVRRKSFWAEVELHELAVTADQVVVRMPEQHWVHIAGTCRGPDGEIVPNVSISPQFEDDGSSPVETVDPATGAFALGPYPPGRYTVTFSADGFPHIRVRRTLGPDERWELGELRFARGGTVAIQAIAEVVDAKHQRADVYASDGSWVVRLDLDAGAGRSEPLAPGDYEVLVTSGAFTAMVPCRVEAGIETRLDVPLARGEQATLRATAPDAGRFHGSVVLVVRDGRDRVVWRGTAWARDGVAEASCRLPKGRYRVAATWRERAAAGELTVDGEARLELALR